MARPDDWRARTSHEPGSRLVLSPRNPALPAAIAFQAQLCRPSLLSNKRTYRGWPRLPGTGVAQPQEARRRTACPARLTAIQPTLLALRLLPVQKAWQMFNFNDQQTAAELLSELERFIVYWLGPRCEECGEPAENLADLDLPEPLRRLYSFAGRWPGTTGRDQICEEYGWVTAFSSQDLLLRPDRLELSSDGKVKFIVENQGVWSLATLSSGDDPPVWIDIEEIGFGRSDEWPVANDSLSHCLTTFCLQELTFGARFGVWDSELSKLFRSGQQKITPLWLNGTYASPESKYSFYLMEGDVLVGHFPFGDDSLFFSANSEQGIAWIRAHESPIVTVRLSIPTGWNVLVHQDGSGEVYVFSHPESKATFSPGTINFAALRDDLLAIHADSGDYRRTPLVYFMRSGRGYSDGLGISDWNPVMQVIEKSISSATQKEPHFDTCLREIPFRNQPE